MHPGSTVSVFSRDYCILEMQLLLQKRPLIAGLVSGLDYKNSLLAVINGYKLSGKP